MSSELRLLSLGRLSCWDTQIRRFKDGDLKPSKYHYDRHSTVHQFLDSSDIRMCFQTTTKTVAYGAFRLAPP